MPISLIEPSSTDLAAQTFRADLFSDHGFQVWSNAWYDGFHLPGYSLLFPPLASLLGIRLVGAVSAVVASLAFNSIVKRRYGSDARWAGWLFGIGVATNLYTNRLTFALGVALGLLALLAIDRGRRAPAALAAVATSAASPVAGLFLALAGAALWLRGARREGLLLAVPALVTIAVFSLGFPTTGTEPFVFSSFIGVPLAVAALLVVLSSEAGALRTGAIAYLVLCVALYIFDNPVGGNAVRLATVFGPALLALGLAHGSRKWLTALAVGSVLAWSLLAPIRDVVHVSADESSNASYFAPLLDEVAKVAPARPFRIEVPPTRQRWESVYVAERYPLARGWLRQLESEDFALFRGENLSAGSYRAWLDRHAVTFVAVADAQPDYLSEDEGALIASGLPYLREVWSNADWKLYRVANPKRLADRPARVERLDSNSFLLSASAAGTYDVRVSPSRWWHVSSGPGCAESTDNGLRVHLDKAGQVTVIADLSLAGVLGGRGRC